MSLTTILTVPVKQNRDEVEDIVEMQEIVDELNVYAWDLEAAEEMVFFVTPHGSTITGRFRSGQ